MLVVEVATRSVLASVVAWRQMGPRWSCGLDGAQSESTFALTSYQHVSLVEGRATVSMCRVSKSAAASAKRDARDSPRGGGPSVAGHLLAALLPAPSESDQTQTHQGKGGWFGHGGADDHVLIVGGLAYAV